ncbi:MAG: 3-phosphoserine/phosphohydroxythreonine transaminase [Gammaproteobacteria bacterium]|nr:3-phosphoserine/phosphohydroxythreonine transaminase [Gammaproteobacteria bacterium]
MTVYNFSAGPAALPGEVLERVRDELLDWNHDGMSVMEVSHRGAAFMRAAEEAEADLRELLAVPAGYRVLFLQGGASAQFSLVPMNLSAPGATADYVDTGHWSSKAIREAARYCRVNVVAGSGPDYLTVPAADRIRASAGAAYLHYTPNETIGGVEFPYVPDSGSVPLVADMSSTILSRPIDVARFGLIYAGAQKNIGPAGLVVVLVREDLIGHARADTPTVFDYAAVAAQGSMLNTPPTFAWYVAGLVFKWLKARGGLAAMAARNREKAERLYAAIDASSLYRNAVAPEARSWMNVTFRLARSELDGEFLRLANAAGLRNLKGHKAAGGMRASIYNSMPVEGVATLIEFMREFERAHG